MGTWRKLEAGEISASPQTLERVAEALDTTPENLLRAPRRNSVPATAAAVGGLHLSEYLPEEMRYALLEPIRRLAARHGLALETLAEMAEELDIDPRVLLDKLSSLLPSETVH